MPTFWNWLLHTDGGLFTRIACGVTIFAILAMVDLRRHGQRATRWREYVFLLYATAVAMAYGAVNDLITSRISWEYFYYGKELSRTLGPASPPDPAALAWAAVGVGMKATWSAGLIVGVALLFANNPRIGLPQLPYRRLAGFLPRILVVCIVCAAVLGVAGSLGLLTGLHSEFGEMIRRDEMRPYRFMTVFGVHLGGYAGGAIGAIWGMISVRSVRRRNRVGAK